MIQFNKVKDIIFFTISFLRKKWFYILCLILIIFITPPSLSWLEQATLFVYAFSIFWIINKVLKEREKPDNFQSNDILKYKNIFIYLLILSLFFLLFTRLLPFVRFGEAPLGYDTGFYVKTFEEMSTTLEVDQRRAFYLNLLPLKFLGMSPLFAVQFIYILSQFLIAGSLYILFRSLKIKFNFAFASIAVFLFVISITQFQAYWWMFGQQMLAMGFFFVSLALFFRYPILSILTGCVGILSHFPTFAMFGLSILIFIIFYAGRVFLRKKFLKNKLGILFIIGLSALVVFYLKSPDVFFRQANFFLDHGKWLVLVLLIIYLAQKVFKKVIIDSKLLFYIILVVSLPIALYSIIPRVAFWGYVNYIFNYRGLLSHLPAWKHPQFQGLFIDFSTFRLQNLSILPFAVITFCYPYLWRKIFKKSCRAIIDHIVLFYIMSLSLLALIIFPFIYQHRFIILFDVVVIFFIAPAFFLLIRYFLQNKFSRVMIWVFIFICFIRAGSIVWAQQPQLYADELVEIRALASITEPEARILATDSLYTPWVVGFSGRTAFGPGIGDLWNFSEWMQFWTGEDDEVRYQLLDKYEHTLYLFIGKRQDSRHAFQEFIRDNSRFTKISPHIWKYNPDL